MRKSLAGSVAVLMMLCGSMAAAQESTQWVGTWAASPMGMDANPGQPSPDNATYRDLVHISMGGSAVRVQLTNEFGIRPLTIGAAHVALSAGGGAIQPGTDHALTFGGQATVTIPAGAMVYSDPVAMPVQAMANLAVSVYLPQQWVRAMTCHELAVSTNYVTVGNTAAAETLTDARPLKSWCFVKGIDVSTAQRDAAAIVTLGDSITDGAHSTPDTNRRWPDDLAQRLQENAKTAHLSVLNEGISGNRILHDGAGPNALARFDRDVIAQSGVKYLIILEGINDIGAIARPQEAGDNITAQDLIWAMEQMIARAHEHGIRVFGATLTPYVGAGYASPEGEQIREALNQWIRTSGKFDGVIDLDKATRNPENPNMFAPSADSGDHLHPGDAGYAAMANAIDLSLFH